MFLNITRNLVLLATAVVLTTTLAAGQAMKKER